VTTIVAVALGAALAAQEATLPARIRKGGAPKTVAELRALEAHVQALIERALPATVSLDGASGVLVEGGYVLTAGHVVRANGRRVRITLHDGRRLSGVTLGADLRADTGLVRITTAGDYPALELGESAALRVGEWCVMLGHPSGAAAGRSAPARLGRVQRVPIQGYLVTDCPMQAGDSGGPLLDLDGRIVGIHSRISEDLAENMHVPADAFRQGWQELVDGKVTEPERRRGGARANLGVRWDRSADGAWIREVVPGSPAAKAGLRAQDLVVAIDGEPVENRFAAARAISRRQGDQLALDVRRNGETWSVTVDYPRRRP
jgi:serine protease Do